jgi:hypothetical protein
MSLHRKSPNHAEHAVSILVDLLRITVNLLP